MSENFGVDFIARCIAAEALEKAESGNSNVADVDASVSGSQLTIQLEDGNGDPVGSGSTVNLPNGLPPSTSADEGKVLTVNSSGSAEWDESKVNVFRTAYRSVLDDYTSSYDANGNWVLTFQPEVSFEKLDVYLQWHFDWSAGTDWPLRTATRSIMLSLTKDVAGPVVSTGMNVYLANSVNQTENPNANLLYDILMGSINVNYDEQTNTVTMLVAKPIMDAVYDANHDKNNLPVVMTNCVANAFGYVAYGSDDYVVYEGLIAGTGIDITNDVISLDADYGADIDLSLNSSTNVLTATLKDQNGNTIGTAKSVTLPYDPMIVRTAYVPLTAQDYTKTKINDNKYNVVFDAPAGFELLEARVSYSITFTCGSWVDATLTFSDTLSIPSSVGSTPREGRKIYSQKLADHWTEDNPPIHYNQMVDEITGANLIYYDAQTGKITLEIGNLTAPYVDYTTGAVDNTTLVISDLTIISLGYVAYGPNTVNITTGLIGGNDINISGDTISFDGNAVPDVGSTDDGKVLTADYTGGVGSYSWESISTSDRTYYCECSTAAGTAAKVVTTTQDFELEQGAIIAVKFTNQNTATNVTLNVNNSGAKGIAVGATVPYAGDKPDRCGYGSGYLNYYIYNGTYWHAMGCSRSVNEVPATNASQNGRVLTNDNGIPTWLNLPSVDEVPDVTSTDDGKVLTADYTGGIGSYSWETIPTPADMATQTWVSQQGYLTSADEVPTVTSNDDGKVLTASYTGGTGSYSWQAPAASGLQVETDGTNYWITVNNVRLYFASSGDPVGNIPDGSVGIGWTGLNGVI